jgi:hypothetical protein
MPVLPGATGWRAVAFQPDYWVVKKFKARLEASKPRSVVRKKIIVALARLIAVDLWRLYIGQTTLAKLGLKPITGKLYELKAWPGAATVTVPTKS